MNTLKPSKPTTVMNNYHLLILLFLQLFCTLSSLPLVAGASPDLVNVSSVDIGRALVFVPSPERLVPGKPPPWPYMNPATRNPMNAIHLVLDTSLGNVLPSANISSISSLPLNSSQDSISLSSIAQTIPIPTPDLYILSIYISAMSLFIYLIYYNISTRKALRSTTSRLQTLTQSHANLQDSARRHAYWTRILFSLSTKQATANKTLQAEKTGYLERISALLVDKEALSGQVGALQVKMGEQTRRAHDANAAFCRQIAILNGQVTDAALREDALLARIQDLEQAAREDRAIRRKVESERDDLRARFEAVERAFRLEQEKNERLEVENSQLKTTLDKGNSTIQELTSTVTELKSNIADLTVSKDVLVAECTVKDATVTEQYDQLSQRATEILELTQSKDTLAQQCTSLKAQLIDARSDFVNVVCVLSRTVIASSADRTTIADQRMVIRELKTRVVDLEDFTLQCLFNIEHAKDQVSALTECEESLQREVVAKDDLLADRSRELGQVDSQLRDSIASRTALEDHLASKTRLLSERDSELCDARTRISELEAAVDAVHGESTGTAILLAECHSKLDRALSDNSDIRASEARITHLHAEAASKLERAEVEIQDLVSHSAAKDTLISDQQEQLERARWEITGLQATVTSLEERASASDALLNERRDHIVALEERTTELEDLLSDSMFNFEEAKDKIFELTDSEAELRRKTAALEGRLAQCSDELRDASAHGEELEDLLTIKEDGHKTALDEMTSNIEALQKQKDALESKASDQYELLEETMMELMQCGEEVKACHEREAALQGKVDEQDDLLEETMMRLLQRDEEADERDAALEEKVGELEALLQAEAEARTTLKLEVEAKTVDVKCKEFELEACAKKCEELEMEVAMQRTTIALGEEEHKARAEELKKLRLELAMVKLQSDAGVLDLDDYEEQEVEGMLDMGEEGYSVDAPEGMLTMAEEFALMEEVEGVLDIAEEEEPVEATEELEFAESEEPAQFIAPARTTFSPRRPSPLNPLPLTPPATPPTDESLYDRDISILRTGILVRQALRSFNAPVPQGDPEHDVVKPPVEKLPLVRLPSKRKDENYPWSPSSIPAFVPYCWRSSNLLEHPSGSRIPSPSRLRYRAKESFDDL
ncbi:hypothetical protein DENSPDRAFT_443705 [Dentipellis sp. KUC8613]|nr:hypothetical protein DENSPDRAFT_443705 [Dentipellis sp. KUC8613]